MTRDATKVNDLVYESVMLALEGVGLVGKGSHGDPAIASTVRDDEAALADLAQDFYVNRTITRAQFDSAQRQLMGRLDASRRALATELGRPVLTDGAAAIRAGWSEYTIERQRAIIGAVVEAVEIRAVEHRGRARFDPSRISIKWRY